MRTAAAGFFDGFMQHVIFDFAEKVLLLQLMRQLEQLYLITNLSHDFYRVHNSNAEKLTFSECRRAFGQTRIHQTLWNPYYTTLSTVIYLRRTQRLEFCIWSFTPTNAENRIKVSACLHIWLGELLLFSTTKYSFILWSPDIWRNWSARLAISRRSLELQRRKLLKTCWMLLSIRTQCVTTKMLVCFFRKDYLPEHFKMLPIFSIIKNHVLKSIRIPQGWLKRKSSKEMTKRIRFLYSRKASLLALCVSGRRSSSPIQIWIRDNFFILIQICTTWCSPSVPAAPYPW